LKVTVPVGVPVPGAVAAIVALNVTDLPTVDGLSEEVSFAVVFALLTVCANAAEALDPYDVLPEYTAVMDWLPAASTDVDNMALPPLTVPDPSTVAPSLKDTVPVIVPAVVELTVAVKVTVWPYTVGLTDAVTAVEVPARTTWVSVDDVLAVSSVLPA
jgi:hypothetical protein